MQLPLTMALTLALPSLIAVAQAAHAPSLHVGEGGRHGVLLGERAPLDGRDVNGELDLMKRMLAERASKKKDKATSQLAGTAHYAQHYAAAQSHAVAQKLALADSLLAKPGGPSASDRAQAARLRAQAHSMQSAIKGSRLAAGQMHAEVAERVGIAGSNAPTTTSSSSSGTAPSASGSGSAPVSSATHWGELRKWKSHEGPRRMVQPSFHSSEDASTSGGP